MMILRYKLGLPINPQKDAEKLETSKKAGCAVTPDEKPGVLGESMGNPWFTLFFGGEYIHNTCKAPTKRWFMKFFFGSKLNMNRLGD